MIAGADSACAEHVASHARTALLPHPPRNREEDAETHQDDPPQTRILASHQTLMLSYLSQKGAVTLPHRAPGAPGNTRQNFLSGKPIRYYRPKGSADIHRLIDEGFQAFNAGRLSEACAIFADK